MRYFSDVLPMLDNVHYEITVRLSYALNGYGVGELVTVSAVRTKYLCDDCEEYGREVVHKCQFRPCGSEVLQTAQGNSLDSALKKMLKKLEVSV